MIKWIMGGGYRYYFLDSQIPDILRLSKNGYQGKFIIRISDVETYNQKLIDISKPKYVWLDYSQFDKFDIKNYQKFILEVNYNLKDDIIPILASPELYNLSYVNLIHDIQNILPKKDFSICTKRPDLWNLYV
ncbi:hypothetical protein [Campylobacter hepaticus]|uniref:hypothetical protein n=1 Tax=Campylobacter hepaticus TaxID=1813019 RepID=UPI0021A9A573|nr:hypothetical protein [Campylobacter hepaticus]